MKLRIEDKSLRFRLTPRAVMRSQENGRVEAEVRFTTDRVLYYSVTSKQAIGDIEIEYAPDCMRLLLPGPWILASEESDQVAIAGHGRVQVLVEKDLQCMQDPDRRDHPDAWRLIPWAEPQSA